MQNFMSCAINGCGRIVVVPESLFFGAEVVFLRGPLFFTFARQPSHGQYRNSSGKNV